MGQFETQNYETTKECGTQTPCFCLLVFVFYCYLALDHNDPSSSLFGEMVRVSKLDLSVFLRTSGLDGAVPAAAWEGEAGGAPAWAAWWQAAH